MKRVYKELGEVAKICGGKRLPKGCKLQSEPTKHKYIRVADFLDNGTVCKDDIQYISDDIFNQIKRYTISSADVYISIAGTIGKSGIVPDELNGANLTENACKLVLNKELDKRFVYLVTISPFFKEQINTLTKKSAQPKLALTRLATVNVPVPPLSEQKEIVEYLDSSFAKIDKLKENAAKNLEEAKALFQSALKDALEPKEGWEEKTLGEMVKDVKYGTSKPACADGAYTYLRMNNITSDGHLDLNDTKTISLDDKELEKCIVRKGDILFNRTNSYEHVGKTCVFTEETPMVIAGYIIRIRLKECLNPYYMNYFFNMKDTKAKLRKISVGAVHQSNINAKAVQTVVIPLPSLSEQQSIVSFLDSLNEKLNTLQQNYSRICDECDALKQAILRQVFE